MTQTAHSPTRLLRLNLGCGSRALPSWTNLDFQAQSGLVAEHDLRRPLPLPDGSCEVVYHSHFLEHLTRSDARRFLAECRRVLAPGGILRVVVPDLEAKARIYLSKLEAAAMTPGPRAQSEHEWMVIEMIDQMVRSRSGGEMLDYLARCPADDLAALRIGDEFDRVRRAAVTAQPVARPHAGLRTRLRRLFRRWGGVAEDEWEAIRFRRQGEQHLWMYDRVSLATLLQDVGFTDCRTTSAEQSRIARWQDDGIWLDVESGRARKPDSLYMEALAPHP